MRGRPKRLVTTAIALFGLLLLPHTGMAAFWDGHGEGYWWYQDPIEPAEPEPIDPPDPEPADDIVPPAPAPAAEPETGRPEVFSALWLKENIEQARVRAVDNPTEENVRAFYYLQKIGLDKATRFTEVAQKVVTGDPFLDENARRPSATYAANAMSDHAAKQQTEALRGLAEDVGLIFVYRSDCPYCDAQAKVIEVFQRQFGFAVTAISADNRPLPGGQFRAFRYDPALLAKLEVQVFPTLFLARPKSNRMGAISYGAVSLEDLRRRILLVAVKEGWIDQAAFAATKPVNPLPLADNLPRAEAEQGRAGQGRAGQGRAGQGRVLEDDPTALVEYIRSKLLEH